MKDTYRGVTITYNENKDRFEAESDGRTRYSDTLTGIKESINKMLDVEAKPKQDKTPAILMNTRWNSQPTEFEPVTITSFGWRKGYYSSHRLNARISYGKNKNKQWSFCEVDDKKLLADTPKNNELIKEINKLEKELEAMKEKYEKKVEALKKKFVFARPKNEDDLPFWD